jgi:hypothetical protein
VGFDIKFVSHACSIKCHYFSQYTLFRRLFPFGCDKREILNASAGIKKAGPVHQALLFNTGFGTSRLPGSQKVPAPVS